MSPPLYGRLIGRWRHRCGKGPCFYSTRVPTGSLLAFTMGPHTETLVNKIEMVQRPAAGFCYNDYKTVERGCMSEMIGKLN